jgi:hypothetical protein
MKPSIDSSTTDDSTCENWSDASDSETESKAVRDVGKGKEIERGNTVSSYKFKVSEEFEPIITFY